MSDVAEKAPILPLPPSVGAHRFVLGSDHLHFGLWPFDLPGISLEEAQHALLERLFGWLPPPPARILLVATGLGLTAFELAERGYSVVALAAVGGLAAAAAQRHPHPGVSFHALTLFDGDPAVLAAGSYDAVVLLEAPLEPGSIGRLLARVRELLAEGGVAVVAGVVAGRRGSAAVSEAPSAADLTVAFAESGFRPVEREAIAAQVAPTCDVMVSRLTLARDRAASSGAAPVEATALREALELWTRRRTGFLAGALGYELLVARKDPYRIRPYRDGDEHEILRMFREVFGVDRTLEHWRWKFTESPYGSRSIAVVVSAEGQIVAHYAGYPVPFYQAGHPRLGFLSHQIGDTMTRPSVRQAGLGKHGILARAASYYYAKFCRDVPFAYGFNTGSIKKLGERYLGYSYIDQVACRAKDLASGTGSPPPRTPRWLGGYSFAELTTASAELDGLFERVRGSYGFLVRRDAAYVGWRYLRCPDRLHKVLAIRRWGRLVGWSAFARRGAALVWGDALVDPRHVAALPGLLRFAAEGPYRGVERVWGWFPPHPDWWTRALVESGFVQEKEPDELTPGFYFLGDADIKRELAEQWYYSYGDSDLF
jgi:hypothetical protein